MRHLKSYVAVFLVALLFSSCSPETTITIALDAIAVASEAVPAIVAPLAAAGKIDQATANAIYAYCQAVSSADVQAIQEWQSTDPLPIKITKMSAAFAAAVAPNIPGLPPEAQAAIRAISAAIQDLLSLLSQQQTRKLGVAGSPTPSPPLSSKDLKKLEKSLALAQKTIATCKANLRK